MSAETKSKKHKYDYNNAWTSAHFWRINLAIPIAKKDLIKSAAAAAGQTPSGYAAQALMERLQRDTDQSSANT